MATGIMLSRFGIDSCRASGSYNLRNRHALCKVPVEGIRVMASKDRPDIVSVYRIRVQEKLDDEWSDWLEGTTITHSNDHTTVTSPAIDQSALRGILNRMWDLNLTVLSVNRTKWNNNKRT
jgi:hypothetical protein